MPTRRFAAGAFAAVAVAWLCAGCTPNPASARPSAANADARLVAAILGAEDARNGQAPALTEGAAHPDVRIQQLALRAAGRIADPTFAARERFPPLPSPPVWPEPAWRLRYRALNDASRECDRIAEALADESWPVRLRAMDIADAGCGTEAAVTDALSAMLELPADVTRREPGGVSWQAPAHALVSLARLRPDVARQRLAGFAAHSAWPLRLYAARAATELKDTATLERLAADADANVAAAAIEGLSKAGGHTFDALYFAALDSGKVQPTRVAAEALAGTPASGATTRLTKALDVWTERGHASERDVRVALLKALGRPAEADRPPTGRSAVPPDAAAMALGAERYLRVTMSPDNGGAFVVRLRGDVAPIMAARILELASRGYYDGLSWHRVEHDFVIQGGSPGSDEYVGYREYLRDEVGTVPHLRGTVGMSTRGHDTGDAQWFINLKDNRRLDPTYTVFGEIVEGMEVVDGVMEGDVIARIRPVDAPR